MRYISLLLFCAIFLSYAQAPDYRPAFDKSDAKGRVNIHANPWFPMNKQPMHDLGGPNTAWIHHTGENLWGQGVKLCEEYGVNDWDVEINEPTGWIGTYKTMLKEAVAVGSKIQFGLFFGCYSKTPEATATGLIKNLNQIREELKSHPNVARIGGRPRVVIYNPTKYKPEQWKGIIETVEAEFGPMVWLADTRKRMLDYLPYFDGISNYGSGGVAEQKKHAEAVNRIWKDYPQKLNDGAIHSTYTCHYHMGGLPVPLSQAYRESCDIALGTNPDSLIVTNLFDHYENSLVYPCYEREDFMLRYLQYRVCRWQKHPFPGRKEPELVLTNFCQVLLGRQSIDFEVMGFPLDAEPKEVTIQLEMCSTSGKVLKTFPPRTMILDDFRVETYSVPSLDYVDERGIVPRLVYHWKGKQYVFANSPMTQLSPSIRSYRMYWARSTKNLLNHGGDEKWSMGGCTPGQTFVSDTTGLADFQSYITPVFGDKDTDGYLRHGIRRDGLEFYFTTNPRVYLKQNQVLALPPDGQALHWYHIEIENKRGRRWQSLPIWSTDGTRSAPVTVPLWRGDDTVEEFSIEGARIPFWHYPCQRDAGRVLLDVSGYGHHGFINGSGYGGGHLGFTGYNYYHNGPIPPTTAEKPSIYAQDADGTRYLRFSGKDHVTIMGGTAMPCAATYELCVRPASIGEEMGLIGSGNNQISINILEDGTVTASRRTANEDAGGQPAKTQNNETVSSSHKLKPGKWTRIAVTYDLRYLRLYLDGTLEDEKPSRPNRGHEWINHLLLGAANKWVWEPIQRFKGDIRDLRIYGRNLQPEEFLQPDGTSH